MLKFSLSMLVLGLLVGCTPSPVDQVDAAPKQIALTYDDAPLGDGPRYSGAARTDALIAQLAEAESGPVAIFVTTQGLEQADGVERIAAYAEAGHLIANHSDQHKPASRTRPEVYIADMDLAEEKLAQFDNRRPWFRFPFLDEGGQDEINQNGVKRDIYRAALQERGLISGYVTVDTYDWHLDGFWRRTVESGASVDMEALSSLYIDMVLDAANHYDALSQQVLGRRPVQVLLLHENDLAASFTTNMIAALRADGWEIVDPDIAFDDPLVDQLPNTLVSGGGRITALAIDAGWDDWGTLGHWSVNRGEIMRRAYQSGAFTYPASPPSPDQ